MKKSAKHAAVVVAVIRNTIEIETKEAAKEKKKDELNLLNHG